MQQEVDNKYKKHELRSHIYNRPDMYIGTIHAFCFKILHAYSKLITLHRLCKFNRHHPSPVHVSCRYSAEILGLSCFPAAAVRDYTIGTGRARHACTPAHGWRKIAVLSGAGAMS